MKEIGAFEAKNRLGQLLDIVERGEEVVITRHGKGSCQARAAEIRLQSRGSACGRTANP